MVGRNPEMRQLERNYIFEFAGMPQSGKTAVKEILAHFLKRMEYPVVEFNGGSRYSSLPIHRMPIGELNQKLAQNIERFVRSITEKPGSEHNIYLLDRGLIDRCIFTKALALDNKVSQKQEEILYEFLTPVDLLDMLDGVFIFTTSPETALKREYKDKLVAHRDVQAQGDVMNERFLNEIRIAAEDWYTRVNKHVKHVEPIDTTPFEKSMKNVAEYVFNTIREEYPELKLELMPAKTSSHTKMRPF